MDNPQLQNGYIRIASEIIDALCKFRMPGECRQILDCIFRKTYGFNKKEDWISNSQMVEMTGMKKQNASRALAKLITNKIVIKLDDKLKLNKNYSEWIRFTSSAKVITGKNNRLSSKVITPVIKLDNTVIQRDDGLSSKVMDTIDNRQYTINNITKDSSTHINKYSYIEDIKEEDLIAISNKYQVPMGFVKSELEDMTIWAESKPNNPKLKGRNWKMTLIGFVKRDSFKLRKEANQHESKRGIDARGIV